MAAWPKSVAGIFAPPVGSAAFERFCRMFFSHYCHLTVEGEDHLPAEPFLLCSNHSSHADSAALMTASGRSFRRFALLAASDYFFQSRVVRWSVTPLMNVIPIDRQPGPKSLIQSLEICRRFLQQTGGILILYPEGTRSRDGQMQLFKAGVGLFAMELGVPVVPANVEGTHHILAKGRFLPRRGLVTVRFGQPLEFSLLHGSQRSLRGCRHAVVEQLTQSIRLLSHGKQTQELVAGVPEKR
jgi:1-acyl-sn-glycerol-3-phosphate acyltransferase